MSNTDFYTTLKRSMFRRINEVGAKPFLLFQYYLTYSTAPKINPSLKTVAIDMGILDKKGNPQISAVSHLKKVLIEAGWIKEENRQIFITSHLEKVEKISTKVLRKSQQPIEKISSKVEKISIESLENLNSPYIRIENKQLEISETTIKKDIYSAHENFSSETENSIDEEFAAKVEETFLWIRQKKNLKNLPQQDWIGLLTDLEKEDIFIDDFREFYNWVENLKWVTGVVSIKLLRGQIEAYKNREIIEAKNAIKRNETVNGVNQNGTDQRLSEREKSAQRGANAKAMVAELRRVGAEEREKSRQNLLGGGNGTDR